MATTRTPTGTWTARNGSLYMITPASGVTFNNSNTLSGSFASVGFAVEAAVKNITITPPETAYEKQDLLGNDTNEFQNQLLDEKPVGTAQLTATLVLGEDETVEDILSGALASAPTGYARYRIGNVSNATVAACVTLISRDTANEASFAFDNAKFSKLGDTRISGPDSHWEQDITIMCLPKDYYFEFKN